MLWLSAFLFFMEIDSDLSIFDISRHAQSRFDISSDLIRPILWANSSKYLVSLRDLLDILIN